MSIQGTNGSIPFPVQRAGQAYASQSRAIQPARPPAEAEDATPERLDRLVAGSVDSPINRGEGFDEASGERSTSDPAGLKLYNRAADVVEVATELGLGRTIDVTG